MRVFSSGTAISPSTGFTGGGLSGPYGIAVDAAGNVWVANYGGSSLIEFNSSGTAISGYYYGYYVGGLPYGIALDAAGNVWVANYGGNSISEFIGLAKPVRTPLVACLKASPPHAVCLP